jgi:hypothetical protein
MNAQRFQGKVAVVTGGNSGIGLGVAKAYAQEGAQVAITGRNKNTLEAAAKEIGEGTLVIRSDAGKVAEIEAAMKRINERFGRIDRPRRTAGRDRRGSGIPGFRQGQLPRGIHCHGGRRIQRAGGANRDIENEHRACHRGEAIARGDGFPSWPGSGNRSMFLCRNRRRTVRVHRRQ